MPFILETGVASISMYLQKINLWQVASPSEVFKENKSYFNFRSVHEYRRIRIHLKDFTNWHQAGDHNPDTGLE